MGKFNIRNRTKEENSRKRKNEEGSKGRERKKVDRESYKGNNRWKVLNSLDEETEREMDMDVQETRLENREVEKRDAGSKREDILKEGKKKIADQRKRPIIRRIELVDSKVYVREEADKGLKSLIGKGTKKHRKVKENMRKVNSKKRKNKG